MILKIDNQILFTKMSQEEESIIAKLTAKQENQARRTSQLLTQKELQSFKKEKENTKTDVILLADDQKFQASTKKQNIFAKKQSDLPLENIFLSKKSVNLFNLTNSEKKCGSIFNESSQPLIKDSQDDDELSLCSQKSEDKIEFKSDPETKVMKYNYEDVLKHLFEFSLRKFKSAQGEAKDNVVGRLQVKEGKKDKIYIIIRSKQTKIILYQALIMKGISKIEPFMNKNENIRMNVVTQKRSFQPDQTPIVEKDIIKMQFQQESTCNSFKEEVKRYFQASD